MSTELIEIPTCTGCGAMSRPSLGCEGGCREERALVVAEAELEAVLDGLERERRRLALLRETEAGVLAAADLEAAQQRARDGLAALAELGPARIPAAAAPVEIWRCPRCEAVDAPQPCLGICIWQPLRWVEAGQYLSEREQLLQAAATSSELERALVLLAAIRCAPECAEQNLRAIRTRLSGLR